MAHKVKCIYCSQTFDRDKHPFVQVSQRRYAHKECSDRAGQQAALEEKYRVELFDYLETLFKGKANYPVINKLLKRYTQELNFTYSGILRTLKYWYEVKGHTTEKANNSIGIVEFQYQNAYNYYYSIWQANQHNKDKVIQDYVPIQKTIHIPVPERNLRKRKLFTFLDEEEESGGQ